MAQYSIGPDGAQGIKKLGFGLMRLPKAGEAIDVEQTKRMVDLFMDAGFTYFDTAWAYAGSEEAITPIKQFSTTASSSRPAKIRPVTLLLIIMKAGIDRANSATLPIRINGRRPKRSLSIPITGCTNSIPTMIAMMISTP